MKGISSLLGSVIALIGAVVYMDHASGQADGEATPIFGVKIPLGWDRRRHADYWAVNSRPEFGSGMVAMR
jgi:hypothetical protein